MRRFYLTTFLIGLGFFTMGLMDPLYDTYVPIFLRTYIDKDSLVGAIMGLDNLFALALIPVVSAWSDRTHTRIGRRMPFILVTLPATAVFFAILPYATARSLFLLVAVIFLLNIFKQAARGPVVALMPDTVPGEYRSEANGVINTMGGIAAIVGTVGLARLMDLDTVLPVLGPTKGRLPFPVAGFLVVLATVMLFAFVREKGYAKDPSEKRIPVLKSLKMILAGEERSALFILISLFFWFLAYQGVLPWVGVYTVDYLNVSEGTAALSAGMVGIAYAVFAIPSGIVAHKIGRKKIIRISLLAQVVLTVILYFHYPLTLGLSRTFILISFWGTLFLFGIFWVSIITNSFPMLWQMASFGNMGIYTGLYYTFSQSAAIAAPIITGVIRDITNDRSIFLAAAIFMLTAFITMGFVKRGEAGEKAVIEEQRAQ